MMSVHQGQIFMDPTKGVSIFSLGNNSIGSVKDLPEIRFDLWIPYNFFYVFNRIDLGRI